MAIFADLQYYLLDVGGWALESRKHADVILEWSLMRFLTSFLIRYSYNENAKESTETYSEL